MYGIRLLRQRSVQLAALGIVAGIVLAFRAVQFALLTREIQWGYDFSAYWAAAGRLLGGLSPYEAHQLAGPYSPQEQFLYLYPPPLAVFVMPLRLLFPDDYRAAAWIWTAMGAAILLVSVLAIAQVERLGDRYPLVAGRGRWLLVAAAFAFPPVIGELVLGNVHLLLLGLLTLAWLGLRRGTTAGKLVSGISAGVAAIIKIFPGTLLLWFLLRRRWLPAAGFIAGTIAIGLVTLSATGLEPWLQYPAVLGNLSAAADTRDTLAPTVWLTGPLPFALARVVVNVAGLAIVIWSALRLRSDEARSFAVAVTVSILIAPALYHHYLALLVLPFLLALAAGVPVRWLAIAYFLMWGGDQPGLGDAAWIVNRALPTAGALTLLGGLLLAPSGDRAQPRAVEGVGATS